MHYQLAPYSQAKLVRVIKGAVLDVAVDLRRNSPTYLKSVAVELTEANKRQLFVPRGFAHGFQVLSDEAVFAYKVDNVYQPSAERSLRFDDPDLAVQWRPMDTDSGTFLLSDKDLKAPFLKDAEFNFEI